MKEPIFSGPSGRKPWRRIKKTANEKSMLPEYSSELDNSLDKDTAFPVQKEVVVQLQKKLARDKVKSSYMTVDDGNYEIDLAEIRECLKGGIRLEKPQGSSLHHLIQFIEEQGTTNGDGGLFIKQAFQSMVIEHDWAQAFDNVKGFKDDGEVPMPFDFTCFEFRISGLRALLLMGVTSEGTYSGALCTGVNGRWYVNLNQYQFIDGKFIAEEDISGDFFGVNSFLDLIGRQIRAVCIMLDAGVAEATREAPSEKLNKARRRQGRTELKAYHVVRLGERYRRTPAEKEDGTGIRLQLHVRRGHWRHFDSPQSGKQQFIDQDGHLRSKTWIEWTLVGDVDLGFVDKEYRL